MIVFKRYSGKNKMMKIGNLQKIMILSLTIFATCFLTYLPAFGQGVELAYIQTNPLQVHVGDSFHINATIVNNSPDTVYFNGGCQSPLSAIFDKNIVTGQAIGCFAILRAEIKPGQNVTISGPSSASSYTAASSGATDANVIFSYHTGNKSENTISKLFTFDISESKSIPEFPLSYLVLVIGMITILLLKNMFETMIKK